MLAELWIKRREEKKHLILTTMTYTSFINTCIARHCVSLGYYMCASHIMEPPNLIHVTKEQGLKATMHGGLFSLPLIPLCHPRGPHHSTHKPTSRTSRAVHPSAILRSVTLASHDILSHRQPHSSSVSSCEGAWDPTTGGGYIKGRPTHSCSLSLQQPAPVCNHY